MSAAAVVHIPRVPLRVVPEVVLPARNQHQAKYRAWRRDLPEIYRLFVQFELQAVQPGRPFGMQFIAERGAAGNGCDLGARRLVVHGSNNHHAYLPRDVCAKHSVIVDFIRPNRSRLSDRPVVQYAARSQAGSKITRNGTRSPVGHRAP